MKLSPRQRDMLELIDCKVNTLQAISDAIGAEKMDISQIIKALRKKHIITKILNKYHIIDENWRSYEINETGPKPKPLHKKKVHEKLHKNNAHDELHPNIQKLIEVMCFAISEADDRGISRKDINMVGLLEACRHMVTPEFGRE